MSTLPTLYARLGQINHLIERTINTEKEDGEAKATKLSQIFKVDPEIVRLGRVNTFMFMSAQSNQFVYNLSDLKFELSQCILDIKNRIETPTAEDTLLEHVDKLIQDKVSLNDAIDNLRQVYVSVVRKNHTTVEAADLLDVCRRTVERIGHDKK